MNLNTVTGKVLKTTFTNLLKVIWSVQVKLVKIFTNDKKQIAGCMPSAQCY